MQPLYLYAAHSNLEENEAKHGNSGSNPVLGLPSIGSPVSSWKPTIIWVTY